MFNYDGADKHITFAHLVLLVRYLETHHVKENEEDMLSSITRNGNEYTLHVTASHLITGWQHRFRIEGEEVLDLGIEGLLMN